MMEPDGSGDSPMSSWVALNVELDEDEWMPPERDASQTKMTIMENPEDDFDVLMYVFISTSPETKEEFVQLMIRKAHEIGTPETLVSVCGSDTMDHFTVELISDSGAIVGLWNTKVDLGKHESRDDFMDRVEKDLGMRPSYGGNYK